MILKRRGGRGRGSSLFGVGTRYNDPVALCGTLQNPPTEYYASLFQCQRVGLDPGFWSRPKVSIPRAAHALLNITHSHISMQARLLVKVCPTLRTALGRLPCTIVCCVVKTGAAVGYVFNFLCCGLRESGLRPKQRRIRAEAEAAAKMLFEKLNILVVPIPSDAQH